MATSLETALRALAAEIKSHRANRESRRAPFPADVWQKLAQLARTHGTSVVAKGVKVDSRTLQSHVRSLEPGQAEFIECKVTTPVICVTTVEVESRHGERMRIQGSNLIGSDLSLLLREFLAR